MDALGHTAGSDAEQSHVSIDAIGDIWLKLMPVVVQGDDIPTLVLNRVISKAGDVDIKVESPVLLTTADTSEDSADIYVPGKKNNFVKISSVTTAATTVIAGAVAGYSLTADGKIKIDNGITVSLEDYLVMSIDTANEIYYNYYYLPTGEMMLTDAAGNIVTVYQVGDDTNTSGYSLDNVCFTFTSGSTLSAITILMSGVTKTDSLDLTDPYNYSQRIVFNDTGTATLFIGKSGGTVTITRGANDTCWQLPDGSKIYWGSAFLKGGNALDPLLWKTNGTIKSYILEAIDFANLRSFYHVAQIDTSNGGFEFDEGSVIGMSTLLDQDTASIAYSMDYTAACAAISSKLDDYVSTNLASITNTTKVEELAGAVATSLSSVITSDWKVSVDVGYTTTTTSIIPEGTTTPETINIVSAASIQVALATTAPEGITTPEGIASYSKTLNLVSKNITPPAFTSFSSTTAGVYTTTDAVGINYAANVLGARKGSVLLTLNDAGTSIAALKIKNGVYTFNTAYDSVLGAYVLDSGTYPVKAQSAYNELAGKYFVAAISGSAVNVKVYELNESAASSGAMNLVTSGDSIETSQSSFNGGYKRVTGGVLFMDQLSSSTKVADGIYLMEDAAIGVLASGDPVQLTISYGDSSNSITNASLMYSPNMIQKKDYEGNPAYSNGLPVYTAQKQKTELENGATKYCWTTATGQAVTIEYGYESVGAQQYIEDGYLPEMEYVDNTVFLSPSGITANVSYLSSANFDLTAGSNGYADAANGIKVALSDISGGDARGTLMFTDDSQKEVAKYTPTKDFYEFETAGVTSCAIKFGKVSDINVNGYLTFDSGTSYYAHQVIDDVYMSLPDTTRTNTSGSSFYFKSDFFGPDDRGENLVQLKTEAKTFNYIDEGYSDGSAFNGKMMLKVYKGGSDTDVALRIIEVTSGGIVILLPYGTWEDSNGNVGKLSPALARQTVAYTNATAIMLGAVEGENVNLDFSGTNTYLTGLQSTDVNIKADQLVVTARDSGDIFSKSSPLIVAPKFTDMVIMRLKTTDTGGAYQGAAYFGTTTSCSINVQNVTVGAVGTLDVSTTKGSIELKNIMNSGTLTATSGMNGNVTCTAVVNTSTGALNIAARDGDVMIGQVDSDGKIIIRTTSGGVFLIDANSLLKLGTNTDETASWLDIDGDLGAKDLIFRVMIEKDPAGRLQTLHILKVDDLYLTQVAESTHSSGLDTTGRDSTGSTTTHDEATSDLAGQDEAVQVEMPDQTPDELAAQFTNGRLTNDQLLDLMDAVLTGARVKTVLSITDTLIDQKVLALDQESVTGLQQLVVDLGLGVAPNANEVQYRTDVKNAYRTSVTNILDGSGLLSKAQIAYVLKVNITGKTSDLPTLLSAAIAEQNGISDSELFAAYWASLTDAQKQQLIQDAWAIADYPDPQDDTQGPQGLDIHIGTSTGIGNISNEGDISITQDTGSFTAGEIVSLYGDVTITSAAIEGTAGAINIAGDSITLTATEGGIGAAVPVIIEESKWITDVIAKILDVSKAGEAYGHTGTNSWTISRDTDGKLIIKFSIDYTSVRDEEIGSATALTAIAVQDININETTGDLGVNVIKSTNGKVTLTAPGSILDVRNSSETSENITAGAGAKLTSNIGTIGTSSKYLTAKVTGGALTTVAYDNINIDATGNLNMIADISGPSGQINVNADNNLQLANTHGDLTLGAITAGGTAAITAEGGIKAGDKLGNEALVKANSIRLTAKNGSIGTAVQAIDIDTDAQHGGFLNAAATNGAIYIKEMTGNLTIGTIHTTGSGSVTLTTNDGSITEITAGNADLIAAAARAAIAAAQARSKADAAQTQVDILQGYFTRLASAKTQIDTAQSQMQQLRNDLTNKLNALANAETILEGKRTDQSAAEQELAQARTDVAAAQTEYDDALAAKQKADQDLTDAQTMLAGLEAANPQDLDAIATQQAIVADLNDAATAAGIILTAKDTALGNANNNVTSKAGIAAKAQQQTAVAESAVTQAGIDITAAQTAITNKQTAITQLIIQLDTYTYGNISAMKGLNDVDAAATAVNAEYSSVATRLDNVKDTRDLLDTLADAAELAADQALAAAAASGVSTDGDLTLVLQNGGSVGESGNALGITVEGDLDVHAGTGKTLDNVYLESGSDLSLDPITATGTVGISALGTIEGTGSGNGVVITAANAGLNSLTGNVGSSSVPFRTSVDRITASGANVYLNNNKSVAVDTIVGGNVVLTASGDVTSGNAGTSTGNRDIIADNATVNASGNIGTSGSALIIDADKVSARSKYMTVRSEDDFIIGTINTQYEANISAGGIISAAQSSSNAISAGTLVLNAAGNIGTAAAPLNVSVAGTIQSDAIYGNVYLANNYQAPDGGHSGGSGGGGGGGTDEVTMRDRTTGIMITGEIDGEFVVTDIKADLKDGGVVSQIIESMGLNHILAAYNLQITGNVSGQIEVTIPLGSQYNGKKLTVIYDEDGKTKVAVVTVENGSFSIDAENPGDFVIMDGVYPVKIIELGSSAFGDVVLTDWFFEGVAYVYGMNLMKGVADQEFAPRETLTRSMLAVILFRLEGEPGADPNTGNVPASWYEEGMNWAMTSGIIVNDEPGDQITREQFVLMLYRYAGLKGWNTGSDIDLSAFSDSDSVSDYAADAMKWAVAVGLIKGRGENDLAPDASLTRADTATILKRLTDIFPTGMILIKDK
jgi:hypothetical protein